MSLIELKYQTMVHYLCLTGQHPLQRIIVTTSKQAFVHDKAIAHNNEETVLQYCLVILKHSHQNY